MSIFKDRGGSTVEAVPGVKRRRMPLRRSFLAAVLVATSVVASSGGLIASQSPAGATPPPPSRDGVLFAWGSNANNALGLPLSLTPPTLSSVPVETQVAQDGFTVRAASAGYHDAFVATDAGGTYSWGLNSDGQLGDGGTAVTLGDTQVALPRPVQLRTVSSGMSHSLGIDTDGQVWAWGTGSAGVLGQGNENSSATPVPVTLPSASFFDPPVTAVAVAASNTTSWAVGSDGRLYVWGQDDAGADVCYPQQLHCSFVPTVVGSLGGFVNVEAALGDFAFALRDDGMVFRLYGSMEPTPVANGNLFATQIASGFGASYAIGLNGRVYAWNGGYGYGGEYGDGTRGVYHYDDPVEVHLPADVRAVAISATYYNGYAIGDDGKLYAWGRNSYGELGIGNATGPQTVCNGPCSTTPVQVSLPANFVPVGLPSEGQSNHTAYAILQYAPPAASATISGTPQSPAAVGAPYNFSFTLGGAASTQVSAGSLPPGVTLSNSGMLSGTPTVPGRYDFTVTASNGVGPNASTAVTIVVQPSISVGWGSILEGDNGTRVLHVPVTLSSPSNTPVTVQYTLQGAPNGGTATGAKKAASGVDFLDNGGAAKTLTFAPTGSGLTPVEKDISVTILGDTIPEGVETFTVQLANPSSGYLLRQSSMTETILLDDVGFGAPTLGIGDAGVVSSNGGTTNLTFPVTLSVPASGAFTVHYTVTPDSALYSSTAAGGGDFGGKKSGTLKFTAGARMKAISLPVWPHLPGSGTKSFHVTLSAVSDTGIVLFHETASGTIVS